jgi:transposase
MFSKKRLIIWVKIFYQLNQNQMNYISKQDRASILLFPVNLSDYKPYDEKILVIGRFIEGLKLNELGFSRTEKSSSTQGRPQYPAKEMLMLYLYGYVNGVRSSRSLEKLTYKDLDLRWLLGNLHPDHKTISNFLKENDKAVKNLFKAMVMFLKEADLIDGKLLVCDGTKYRANASNRKSLTKEMIEEELNKNVRELENYLEEIADDPEEENKKPKVDLTRLTDKDAKEKIKRLHKKVADAQRAKLEMEENKRKRVNLTDPKSRSMLTSEGVLPSFNQQIVVDSKKHFIVVEEVITEENDYHQLNNLIDKSREVLPEAEKMAADAGYYNGPDMVAAEGKIDYYVALNKSTTAHAKGFLYDRERDIYICPQGKEMIFFKYDNWNGRKFRAYGKIDCRQCPLRTSCVDNRRVHKVIWRYIHEDVMERHREKVLQPSGQKIIKRRKAVVEHVFGSIKMKAGKTPLLRRGLLNARVEGTLHCLSYNFIRLINVLPCKDILSLFDSYKIKLALR